MRWDIDLPEWSHLFIFKHLSGICDVHRVEHMHQRSDLHGCCHLSGGPDLQWQHQLRVLSDLCTLQHLRWFCDLHRNVDMREWSDLHESG